MVKRRPLPVMLQELVHLHPMGLTDDWADKMAGKDFLARNAKSTFEHYLQVGFVPASGFFAHSKHTVSWHGRVDCHPHAWRNFLLPVIPAFVELVLCSNRCDDMPFRLSSFPFITNFLSQCTCLHENKHSSELCNCKTNAFHVHPCTEGAL